MTTTIAIDKNGRLALPKKIRERAGIRIGSRVRVSRVDGGLLLRPAKLTQEEKWEEELREIERATGYPRGPEPKDAVKRIKQVIQEVRRQQ